MSRLDDNIVEPVDLRGAVLDRGGGAGAVARAGAEVVAVGELVDMASRIARRRRSCGVNPSSVVEEEVDAEAAGRAGAEKGSLCLTRGGLGDHSMGVLEGGSSSWPQSRENELTREVPRPAAAEVRKEGMVEVMERKEQQ